MSSRLVLVLIFTSIHQEALSESNYWLDMLGFKLAMPVREGNLKEKARPIYLDMQASNVLLPAIVVTICTLGNYTNGSPCVGCYASILHRSVW